MSYSMLPMKVKKIEFSENLNLYNLDKIEVYTFDELLNTDKLLIENIDYKIIVNDKTTIENLSNQNIRLISIYRNPDKFNNNTITTLYAKYFDYENKIIANYTTSGNRMIYQVGFPDRRKLIK
jgi:hypothetical protein